MSANFRESAGFREGDWVRLTDDAVESGEFDEAYHNAAGIVMDDGWIEWYRSGERIQRGSHIVSRAIEHVDNVDWVNVEVPAEMQIECLTSERDANTVTQVQPDPYVRAKGVAVYISGPMTGYVNFNKPAFYAAEKRLAAMGISNIVNPARMDDDELAAGGSHEGKTHADFLRRDLAALLTCDAVYLLPGWEQSEGAMLEAGTAAGAGLLIIAETDPEYPGLEGVRA